MVFIPWSVSVAFYSRLSNWTGNNTFRDRLANLISGLGNPENENKKSFRAHHFVIPVLVMSWRLSTRPDATIRAKKLNFGGTQ